MSEEEIINKSNDYIRLFEKGYCAECNELCSIDNFPNEDLKKLLYAWQSIYQQEKEKNKVLNSEIIRIRATLNEVTKDYVSKEKIREKIESIENMFEVCDEEINYKLKIEDKAKIEVLKELLEEE